MIRLCALLRVRTGFEHFKHFVCINDGVNLLFFFFFLRAPRQFQTLLATLDTLSRGRSVVRSLHSSIYT
jgi:hypothetical protein